MKTLREYIELIENAEQATVDEGVVDKIRGANYNRLSDRSYNQAYDAHSASLDAPKTPAERQALRRQADKLAKKGEERAARAKELGEDAADELNNIKGE